MVCSFGFVKKDEERINLTKGFSFETSYLQVFKIVKYGLMPLTKIS